MERLIVVLLWVFVLGSLAYRLNLKAPEPNPLDFGAITSKCWNEEVSVKHEIRFGNWDSQKKMKDFLEDLRSVLSATGSRENADEDLRKLIVKLDDFDSKLIELFDEIQTIATAEEMERPVAEHSVEGQSLYDKIKNNELPLGDKSKDVKFTQKVSRLRQLGEHQEKLWRQVLILQARMQERYPNDKFDLPD